MKNQGKDCIVGYGNARSNLSRALANLCYQFKIPCHIISPADEDGTRIDTCNSKMVLSCDAKFHYCKKTNVKETVEKVLKDLREEGLSPYYIYGDSTGKGNEHTPMLAYTKVYSIQTNIKITTKEVPGNPLKAEYLIPSFIGELLEQGKMSVKVLRTNDTWYGMTYHEDVAAVKDSFKKMLKNGVYKADLFSDL